MAILGNSESLGLLTYDACLSEGLRPLRPAGPDDGGVAPRTSARRSPRRWRTTTCDAVVVTAIPAVGEASRRGTPRWPRRCGRPRRQVPGKPVLVVHVELGGLAEALSAAASTRTAGRVTRRSGAAGGAAPVPPRGTPAHAWRRGHPQPAPALGPPATGSRSRLIPAYPAAERAVRALAEAVQYAQWRREAAEPGKVPESRRDIDEKRRRRR